MGELNKEILDMLHKLALNGAPVGELVEYVISATGLGKNSRLQLIAYFSKAFSLKISDVSIIGSWEFFEAGGNKFDTIEASIKPLIGNWKNEIQKE